MNGKKLLHILVCCATGAFSVQWLGSHLQFLYTVENYPMNVLKGYICTQTKIHQFEDAHINISFSIKPKLAISFTGLLLLIANMYFTKSAYKMAKKYKIPKRRVTLIDMKTQNIYVNVILINIILDQMLNGIIQLNYKQLEEQDVFKIWWIFHLLEMLQVHVIANVFIIRSIHQKEEFNGFVGRRFPGQGKPRPQVIQPERKDYKEAEQDSVHPVASGGRIIYSQDNFIVVDIH